jgi:hypothetical protein
MKHFRSIAVAKWGSSLQQHIICVYVEPSTSRNQVNFPHFYFQLKA